MTKYEPLERWLREIQERRVTLRLHQIEEILGSTLPASSSTYEAHWRSAGPGRPGGAIAAAGWGVERIDWLNKSITLIRRDTGSSTPLTPAPSAVTPESLRASPEAGSWQSLEAESAAYFSKLWNTQLGPRSVLVGGTVPKSFDLVSPDGRFVGDAKQYKNIRTPAAKWQGIAEYVWLLQHVEAERRFLVFGGDAMVAQRFLDRWRAIVEPVEFYHLTGDEHRRL